MMLDQRRLFAVVIVILVFSFLGLAVTLNDPIYAILGLVITLFGRAMIK